MGLFQFQMDIWDACGNRPSAEAVNQIRIRSLKDYGLESALHGRMLDDTGLIPPFL